MTISVSVILLIPQDLTDYARSVGKELEQTFGITQVIIRSSSTPPDRLLAATSQSCCLYVALGHSTSSTACIETDSANPIITLSPTAPAASTALSIAKCCSLDTQNASLRNRVHETVQRQRQARIVADSQLRTSSPAYSSKIAACFDGSQQVTTLPKPLHCGKVRNTYAVRDNSNTNSTNTTLALVTTDRQSGFDRNLAQVPYKGAVLNLTSRFWFQETKDIIPNHLISVPHPYISVCRKCEPFPIEFVVRCV